MKKISSRNAIPFRRCVQILSLILFLSLLGSTVWPLTSLFIPQDFFLRVDPLVTITIPLTVRSLLPSLIPGIMLLFITLLLGRIFCGYICPMGTTLDLSHSVLKWFLDNKRNNLKEIPYISQYWYCIKYLALTVILTAAVLSSNIALWGAPIPLITRFYSLLMHPIILLFSEFTISQIQPLFDIFNLNSMNYLAVSLRRFYSLYFLLAFFSILFLLELLRPRFWCRYLCPAGALLALLSWRPIWRRNIINCINCGQCSKHCPTGAINAENYESCHRECISCHTCKNICPVHGITFSPFKRSCLQNKKTNSSHKYKENNKIHSAVENSFCPMPTRRTFIGAAGVGILLTSVQYSGAHSLLRLSSRGDIWEGNCIRPPGAIPEPSFLDRCIRCGQCMKACPTNGLQPTWLAAGPEGIFSPILVARRGPCEPDCNVCGHVCPTRAIRDLPLAEKHWAKIGTAVVLQYRCIAWAESRRCMVCQESCPYGAVNIIQKEGLSVPVPVVNSSRCYGCGYCEQHCPVRVPAIIVQPLNALRLNSNDYMSTAKAIGLELMPRAKGQIYNDNDNIQEGELPPGFTE